MSDGEEIARAIGAALALGGQESKSAALERITAEMRAHEARRMEAHNAEVRARLDMRTRAAYVGNW